MHPELSTRPLAGVLAMLPALATAHPGHAAAPWHVHAADPAGWLALAALVIVAVWFGRRR